MSFSRYVLEIKQVSTDRGVTWEDVTPSETRNGRLIGVSPTLIGCEDLDCDLEEYRYELIEDDLKSSYCNTSFPYGILKTVTFTDGGLICGVSSGSMGGCNVRKDINGATLYPSSMWYINGGVSTKFEVGTVHTWHAQDECRAEIIYKTIDVNGDALSTSKQFNCCNCCDLDTCFTVDEYMPWVGDKLKMIVKKHYKKNHCSEEWYEDETYTPEVMGFGERWIKSYEDVYKVTWQHQLAVMTDDNTTLWENDGQPFDIYYEDTDVPENIEMLEYIMADGVACASSAWTNHEYYMDVMIDPTNLGEPSGRLATATQTQGYTRYSWYINISWWGDGDYVVRSTIDACDGNHLYPNEWGFANICKSKSPTYLFCQGGSSTNPIIDILDNVKIGKLRYNDGTSTMFPYKVPAMNGWSNPYYNASEYGYIDRFGNKIVLEYVYGKYTDSSGVTHNLASRNGGGMNIPDDIVSVVFADYATTLPMGTFENHTNLTAVTLGGITTIENNAFKGCTSLTSIDLGKVSSIGTDAFSGCTSLSSISFGTSANTSIEQRAFAGCTSLQTVSLTSVSSIGDDAFNGCSSLSSVTLTEGLATIGGAFVGTQLRSIEIPSTTSFDGTGAFYNVSTLEDVTIHSSAVIKGSTFRGCNIKTLTFTVERPPQIQNGYTLGETFSFAANPITLVPCEYVDNYINTYPYYPNPKPIPNEYRWSEIGYVCDDNGMRCMQSIKQGRDSGCTDDEWFNIPEYKLDEPIGECLYEELYYIERDSSHNGVITDLGITLKDNTRFEIKLNPTSNGGGMIVGEVNAPSDKDDYRFFWYSNSIFYDYGSSRNNVGLSINNTYELEVGNYYIKHLNGSDIIRDTTKSGVATAHTRTMGMFGSGDYAEIYYLKVYEGDTQVKNFIPVRREDGLVTLYDTIGHTFCNVENGTFRASDE